MVLCFSLGEEGRESELCIFISFNLNFLVFFLYILIKEYFEF